MVNLLLILAAFIASLYLTNLFKRYAISEGYLDVPNERSSHERPTPRSGGTAIAISYLVSLSVLFLLGRMPTDVYAAFLGSGIIVSSVGLYDDFIHLSARIRIAFHIIAALWVVACVSGIAYLHVFGVIVDLGWLGYIFATILLVWLLNLYNFMDGIDGMAGVEIVTVAGSASLLFSLVGQHNTALWLALIVAASLGFLVWNWPPAKIFMGDVGSGFLGLTLGVFIVVTSSEQSVPIWTWLILLGVFIVDASTTLLVRIIKKEKWYAAHCDHAYQHAAKTFNSHKVVTLSVAAINILWLLPWAWLSIKDPMISMVYFLVAYLPLVILAVWFRAGITQSTTAD